MAAHTHAFRMASPCLCLAGTLIIKLPRLTPVAVCTTTKMSNRVCGARNIATAAAVGSSRAAPTLCPRENRPPIGKASFRFHCVRCINFPPEGRRRGPLSVCLLQLRKRIRRQTERVASPRRSLTRVRVCVFVGEHTQREMLSPRPSSKGRQRGRSG